MDALAEVLRSVRLQGGVFLDARFTAPWCVSGQVTAEDCRPFKVRPVQVIGYHLILNGRLVLVVDGEAHIEVGAGEIALLPRNDRHLLASQIGLRPVNADTLIQSSASGGLGRIIHGGGGEPTHMICGFLCSEDAYNPLIDVLPKVLKLDLRQSASREWIEASLRFAAGELRNGDGASTGVLSRLSELLLVEAVRQYCTTLNGDEVGWLRGLKDPSVGRALALIHQNINAPWSADALAYEVAMSRSAFVERFRACIGVPPIRYITVLRLQTARLHLRRSHKSVGQIAHAIGYASEEAFSRAFKREFGLSPAYWREKRVAGEQ
jgi:AraC-like DNA-binding protein